MSIFDNGKHYKKTLHALSNRIVEAQRPIRILNAIKWEADIQEAFFKSNFKHQPPVDRTYYERFPLDFEPREKRQEFQEIEREVVRLLGQLKPIMPTFCETHS